MRTSLQERWDADKLASISVLPWSWKRKAEPQATELGDRVEKPSEPADYSVPAPRRLKIDMRTLKRYGITDGCPQCEHVKAFQEAKNGLAHSEECRKRLTDEMSKTSEGAARIEKHEERVNRALAEHIRAADEAKERPRAPREQVEDLGCPVVISEDHPDDAHRSEVRPQGLHEDLHRDAHGPQGTGEEPHHAPPRDTGDEFMNGDATSGQGGDAEMDAIDHDNHMLAMLCHIGADPGRFRPHRREHRRAFKKIVMEAFSPHRVTELLKGMPELGMVSGWHWT